MGAVTPSPHWIPEDDFLLKRAVEAGASLESLAKGAVQFSQRYSVQELQDRWYSLLYDPVVSEQASIHMLEFEHSASTHQLRPNYMESRKEIKRSSGKRKAESIQKCYYAMRRRICNLPSNIMGANNLSGSENTNYGDGNRPLSADWVIGNPDLRKNGIQEGPDFDTRLRSYSELATCVADSTVNAVYSSLDAGQNQIQDLAHSGNHASQSFCNLYDSNVSLPGDHHVVHGFDQSKEMPVCNLLGAEGLENDRSACSEFGGTPLHNLGCSSSLPQMPNWDNVPGISTTGLPIQHGEKDQQTGDTFVLPIAIDSKESEALAHGAASSNIKNPISRDDTRHLSPSAEDYLTELSNTLFDFSNEEELLFPDTDGKNIFDKSYFDGLSSLLLDSPYESEFPNVSLGDASVAACERFASTGKGFGPEYRNGVICCTLNTEDPEIPSNDDVFLPFRFPSPPKSFGDHWRLQDTCYQMPSPVKDFSSTQNASGRAPRPKSNQKNYYEPSCITGNYPTGDHRVKFDLPKSNIQNVALRNALNTEGPSGISSANVNLNNFLTGVAKGGAAQVERRKNLDYKSVGLCLDNNAQGPDVSQSFQESATGSRKELEANAANQNISSLNAAVSSLTTIIPGPIDKPLLSDKEEICSENDFDVPCSSDVEAMILDMDLSPDEFDLFTNPEVIRYQHEETKRTIIRLEQAAGAHMQRAIAAQGAFAVLYGRHAKHFIKKPEVLLGRATEDVKVDIDLGREKSGGKISRRQAIIKMDIHGSFHLKNLGKCSIHINGKEVESGQSLVLVSGCLVEVRGLAFVFETSETCIKQHVDSIKKESVYWDYKPSCKS